MSFRISARRREPPYRPAAGFTLVELMVVIVLIGLLAGAVTLASMLMVAVLGLLGLLAAKRQVLVDESHFASWHHPLVEQLRRDLTGARRFELARDRLRLVGYGGRDFDTHLATHRPAEVVYRLTRAAGRTWLLREEIQLDLMSNANRQTEIVCCGPSTIAMHIPGRPERSPRRSGPVPECCRITLAGDAGSQPVIEVLFCR